MERTVEGRLADRMLTTGRHRHTVVGEISWENDAEDNNGRRACTAPSEKQPVPVIMHPP